MQLVQKLHKFKKQGTREVTRQVKFHKTGEIARK